MHEATAGDTNARDCGGHGTNVASIAAGFNDGTGADVEDARASTTGSGRASVELGATKIFNCAGCFDVTTSFTALRTAACGAGRDLEQFVGRDRRRRIQRRFA